MPGLNLQAWEEELGNDIDSDFLLKGIQNGFDIIDENVVITPVQLPNHPSAKPGSELYEKATDQVLSEIQCGNYVICDSPPKIVSPMAAIPKPEGGVRLIHDCSRPSGKSVNDYNSADWQQKFARIDDAANLMTHGCFFAKVDLKHAYRSVKLSNRSQNVTGLSWELGGRKVFMKDTRLPFGASLSPGIFHRLSQAVKRIMARKGFDLIIVYLDDFLIIAESEKVCAQALSTLIQLLRKLGFAIHWGKVVDPTQKITFLGVELNSIDMTLSLPPEKIESFRQELKSFLNRKRASKRQLQSLAGRLSWAASVVKGGRVFLRRIFNKIAMLRHGSHRAQLSAEVRQDISWWFQFIQTFNGRSSLLDSRPIECVFTDASNEGAGGSFQGDWFYFNWALDWPEARTFHINEKEVVAVTLAAYRWAPLWRDKKVIVYSDNSVTVSALNKGSCRNAMVMKCLRSLFWLSAIYNFHLTSKFIPGVSNEAADSASRLHLPGYLEKLLPFTNYSPLCLHMSPSTFKFLFGRYRSWYADVSKGASSVAGGPPS